MDFLSDYLFWGLAIFLLLNCVDLILTQRVIQCGGKEFNPVVKWIYKKWGVKGYCTLKGLVIALFSMQLTAGTLDMWTIWYFDFAFSVILVYMYIDIKSINIKIFPNVEELRIERENLAKTLEANTVKDL